jgi:hypothetical protein
MPLGSVERHAMRRTERSDRDRPISGGNKPAQPIRERLESRATGMSRDAVRSATRAGKALRRTADPRC